MLVFGSAGCGKSHLLFAIVQTLLKYKKAFRVMALTSSSAENVLGSTVDSTLSMPLFFRNRLLNANILAARKNLSGVSYLLIDEVSLIWAYLAGVISIRLSSIFRNDNFFWKPQCNLLWGLQSITASL